MKSTRACVPLLLSCLVVGVAAMRLVFASTDTALVREATLKTEAQIGTQTVCLQSIVEDGWLQNRCSIDQNQCCLWSLDGQLSRSFPRATLQSKLDKITFGGIRVILKGPDLILVRQTHRALLEKEIIEKIAPRAQAKTVKCAQPIFVPISDSGSLTQTWEVVLPEKLSVRANIKIVDAKAPSQVLGWAQAELAQEARIYVARKTIPINSIVHKDDFELATADVLAIQVQGYDAYRENEFPTGVRTVQTLLKGAPLSTGTVERLPLVRLGDSVTLILRTDNLKISTKGVVQSSAALGDMVTVQLPRYNRSFRGRLVEGKLVEVWL